MVPIVWKDPSSWMGRIDAALGGRLACAAGPRIKLANTENWYLDDSAWVELLAHCLDEDADRLVDDLAERLSWKTLRAYHGCRPADLDSYRKHGIRVLDCAAIVAHTRKWLETVPDKERLLPLLSDMTERVGTKTREGHVYFGLDDRFLVERCGQYLIYGSEFLTAGFGRLKEALTTRGRPTIIEVDVPIALMAPRLRTELASLLLRDWARIAAWDEVRTYPQNFGFSLLRDVPPSWIVGFAHPSRIPDPLEQGRIRVFD